MAMTNAMSNAAACWSPVVGRKPLTVLTMFVTVLGVPGSGVGTGVSGFLYVLLNTIPSTLLSPLVKATFALRLPSPSSTTLTVTVKTDLS